MMKQMRISNALLLNKSESVFNKITNRKMLFAGLVLLSLQATNACATVSCENVNSSTQDIVMPIIATDISVGRDKPVGSVIYRQLFVPSFSNRLGWKCKGNPPFNFTAVDDWQVLSMPSGSASSVSGYNNVYPTNIPGIGVSLVRTNVGGSSSFMALPKKAETPYTCSNQECQQTISPSEAKMELVLIKTSNVIPLSNTNMVLASSFPSFAVDMGAKEYPPLVRAMTFRFSGQINIVHKTCATPDVTVKMGQHVLSKFKGVGSTSDWVPFDINLLNCPPFYGHYSHYIGGQDSANVIWQGDSKGEVSRTVGQPTFQNQLYYILKPINPVVQIGTANIVTLDKGPDAATGIGIEVTNQYGGSGSILYNSIIYSGLVLTSVPNASYKIPLKARYYQIDPTVTAGKANAAIEFTLMYH